MPTKVKMQCTRCGWQIKSPHPEIVIKFCKGCKQETEYERYEKKPVINKRQMFDIQCLRCDTVRHAPPIPKQCSCGQRFQNHAENQTLTDVIYNMIVGSEKDKGYRVVTVGRDGMVWWTPTKDSFGDDNDFPCLGDNMRTSQSSYYGQDSSMRNDIMPVPVEATASIFRRKRF